jgi:hypothetical protein
MHINQATMVEALQSWLKQEFAYKRAPKVLKVKVEPGYERATVQHFVVELDGPEDPQTNEETTT